MSKKKHKIIAVIPAYNEEKSIARVILETKKHVDKVIIGDDGSSDLTGKIAECLGAHVIKNDRNRGKGYTLKKLFKEALKYNPDIIVTLDADGQHPPSQIPKLVEPIINNQADLTIGSRHISETKMEIPLYRRIGLKIIGILHKPVIKDVKDTQSGFRAYKSDIVKTLAEELSLNGYGTETEQLYLAKKYNWSVKEVPVTMDYNVENPSKKNPLKHGLEIVTNLVKIITEEKPLYMLGLPGLILTIIGLFTGIYTIWIFNHTRYFSIPLTLLSMSVTITGVLLIISSLILYAITNIKNRLQITR